MDAADFYFQNLRDNPFTPLSIDTERSLVMAAHAGDISARDTLIANNQGMIVRIAKKYLGMAGDQTLMDLIQWGNLGLMHAIRKFEPHRDVQFCTYAVYWIRAYIRRWSMMSGEQISYSDRHLEHRATVRSVIARSPTGSCTAEQVIQQTGMPAKWVNDVFDTLSNRVISLDAEYTSRRDANEDAALAEVITGDDPDYDRCAEAALLRDRISDLPPLWRKVILLRYTYGLTHGETGQSLGISREGSRQIERKAIETLRSAMQVNR